MAKIIQSEKDKDLIIENDYIFEQKATKNDKIYWRCNIRTCSAKITTRINYTENINDILVRNEHNHSANIQEVIKKETIFKMKKLMKQSLGATRSIISTCLRGATRETIEATGSLDNLSKILRNYRNKLINPKPYLYEELKLSSLLSKTFRNEILYQYGPGNFRGLPENRDFLLFYSNSLYEKLKSENIICVDGTFKVVPSPYYQLYTISYLKQHSVFPVVFAILKNKTQDTYRSIFNVLTILNGPICPRIVKTDFENASINALNLTFPESAISGCQFHLGQCLQRKMKQLNIYNFYKTDRIIKKYIKSLTALAFVNPNKITDTFNELINSIDFPDTIRIIYDYFFNNYIGQTGNVRYPTNLWNHFQHFSSEIPRTNNAIEGFHNAFNGSFGTSNYNLYLLVMKIKEEEEIVQQRTIRIESGEVFYRKRRYVLMEERFNEYIRGRNEHFGLQYVFELLEFIFY